MKVPEVDGYTELNYVQSFFHFNGAYFGKLLGEVCLDDIKAAIVTYNPYVNLDAIELVIVDYDEVVYFFAIDTNDIGLLRLIDQQKIIGKPIRFSEPNNARRPNGIIYKDEHKKCYPYLKAYSKVTVKQTQPNFNSHGISILMKGTSIAIETPSGHKIVWSTVS